MRSCHIDAIHVWRSSNRILWPLRFHSKRNSPAFVDGLQEDTLLLLTVEDAWSVAKDTVELDDREGGDNHEENKGIYERKVHKV